MLVVSLIFAACAQERAPTSITTLPPIMDEACVISPDRRWIAISTKHEGVWLVDLVTGARANQTAARPKPAEFLAWSPDSRTVAALFGDGRVAIVNAGTGRIDHEFTATVPRALLWPRRELRFSPTGTSLVVALGEAKTNLFTLPKDEWSELVTTPDDLDAATAVAFSADGKRLALGSKTGDVRLLDAHTGHVLPLSVQVPVGWSYEGVHALAFDPAGKKIAIASGDCTVRIWTIDSEQSVQTLSHCDTDIFGDLAIGSVQFDREGKRLMSTSWGYWETRVWDVASSKRLACFTYGGGNPTPNRTWFSSDEEFVISSLGCRVARITTPSVAEGRPKTKSGCVEWTIPDGADWGWFEGDGEIACVVVGLPSSRELVVQKVPSGDLVLRVPIRAE